MNFTTLEISNFRSFGPAQTISLNNRGLVAIFGQNKDSKQADSNGSGKSSMFSALCWCLWGKTFDDLDNADSVINKTTKKDCKVSLSFTEGSTEYKVTRTRGFSSKKANDLILEIDGVANTAGTNTDTQEMVDNIIGMDMTTFTQSVLMTANGKSFCTMTDKEQKEVLEDILRINVFSKAQSEVKDRIKARQAKLDVVQSELSMLSSQKSQYSMQVSRLAQSEREYSAIVNKDLESLQLKQEALEQKIATLSRETDTKSIVSELEAIGSKLQSTQLNLDGLDNVKHVLIREYDKAKATIDSHIQVLANEQKHIKKDISNINNLAGQICPTCRQPVNPDDADVSLTTWNNKLKGLDELYYGFQSKLDELKELHKVKLVEAEEKVRKVRLELKELQAIQQVKLDAIRKKETSLGQLAGLKAELSHSQQQAETLKQSKNPYRAQLNELIIQSKEIDKKLQLSKYKNKALDDDLKYLNYWLTAFGNKGIKSFVLDSILPTLTERAQYYLDLLSGGDIKISFSTQSQNAKGEWIEKFQAVVENTTGGMGFNQNSSGEKQRINIATSLALGDLAATRSQKRIDMKVLDEVFDGLDESGIDAVVQLLHKVVPDYESIFVISHSDQLKSNFSNIVTVVKENGFSKIEKELIK